MEVEKQGNFSLWAKFKRIDKFCSASAKIYNVTQ